MHVDVRGVAGEGLKNLNEAIHVGEAANETKVYLKVAFIKAGTHAGGIPRIAGKPPACFELLYGLYVLKALNTLLEFQNVLARYCCGGGAPLTPGQREPDMVSAKGRKASGSNGADKVTDRSRKMGHHR